MGVADEHRNRVLLRARDAIDLRYRSDLDIDALSSIACMSSAHFIRTFRSTFGETPHRYLQRRRVERAMEQLRRTDRSITDISIDVGWNSVATFTRTFREVVGCTPTDYRALAPDAGEGRVPPCFVKAWTRPSGSSSFGTAGAADHAYRRPT
ncbi:MAG: AraC family transcriptional regulator [Ilumatobacteraceae bacterium]